MSIQKRWSRFTKQKLDEAPNVPGAYELGNQKGDVVYIGSGGGEEGVRGELKVRKREMPSSVKKFRFQPSIPKQDPKVLEQKYGEKYEKKHKGNLPPLQQRLPRQAKKRGN